MIKVNGEDLDYIPNMTVKQLLEIKNYIFPLLIVKVNEVFVSRDLYDIFDVPDNAVVEIVHLLSGG
ncbi:MAG: sulfur carrier protein ThiS [Patescibacteria group bacterium]